MLILSLWLAVQSWAEQSVYELDVKVIQAGREIPLPHLTLQEGARTELVRRGDAGQVFLDVSAHHARSGILLKMATGSLSLDGERTVEARSRALLLDSVPTQVPVKNMPETFLAITAREI